MREILFRGKWKDTGEWVEGFPVQTVEGNFYIANTAEEFGCGICIQEVEDYGNYEVIPETIGQYTGLTDKNGKKIFEGDIIKIPDDYDEFGINAGEIYEIYFAFGGFRLKPKHSRARGFWLEDDETVEIIGNIYDNPEKEKGQS